MVPARWIPCAPNNRPPTPPPNLPSSSGRKCFSCLFPAQISVMPPTAAQRLKESGRVGKTVGLGLDQIDFRLLIGLFSGQGSKKAGVTGLVLVARKVERHFGGLGGIDRGVQRRGILFQR